MADFEFPGVAPFIKRAGDARGFTDNRLLCKAKGLEHAAKVQSSLGQCVNAHERDRPEILANAVAWRESLAIALTGIDTAILSVQGGLGLPLPAFAQPYSNGSKPPSKRKDEKPCISDVPNAASDPKT